MLLLLLLLLFWRFCCSLVDGLPSRCVLHWFLFGCYGLAAVGDDVVVLLRVCCFVALLVWCPVSFSSAAIA